MLAVHSCEKYVLLTVYFRVIIMAYWERCRYFPAPPGKEEKHMALTSARKKANAKYEAKAYDKTLIRLPKGRLDEIRAHIEPAGESLNGFINRAISETIERDSDKGPQETAEAAPVDGVVPYPRRKPKRHRGA